MKIDENELDKLLKKNSGNIKEIKSHLRDLIHKNIQEGKPTDLYALCDLSGLGPSNATKLYHLIFEQIEVGEGEKPKGEPNLVTSNLEQLTLGEQEFEPLSKAYRITIDSEYTFRVVLVSDTHIGSKHDNIEGLEEMFDRAVNIGAKTVCHSGDLTDGFHRRHLDMFKYLRPECMGFDGQYERVVKKWPRREGVTTYFIAGNHDHFAMDTADADICRHIAAVRDDMVYLKSESIKEALGRKVENHEVWQEILNNKELGSGRVGAVRIGPPHLPPEKRNTIHMMLHPGNGSAQTLSYKPQRIAANLHMLLHSFENMENPQGKRIKPHTLQIGHYHKVDMNILRNVYIFQSGTMKFTDQFHEVNNLDNMMGYWVLEVSTGKDGDIVRINHRYQRPYVEETRYTRRVILMKE